MRAETYFTDYESNTVYKFYSQGSKGRIEFRVIFQEADNQDNLRLYNLAFGTWDEDLFRINDSIELRNGDMDKILATVVYSAFDFLRKNPDAYIFAQGSTPARTRKYQMGITKFLSDVPSDFEILGLVADNIAESESLSHSWEEFQAGTKYLAFLLSIR